MIQQVINGVATIKLAQSDIPPSQKNLDLAQFVSYCFQVATRVIKETWLHDLTNVEIIIDRQVSWPVCDTGSQKLDIRRICIEQTDNNKSLEDLVAIVHPDRVQFSERETSIGSMKLIVTGGESVKVILVNV